MARRKKFNIKLDGIAEKLGAEVYNESSGFICLLPADVHESVLGRGDSVAEAVNNWDSKLQAHLRNAGPDDPVVNFVKNHFALDRKIDTIMPIIPKVRKQVTWSDDNKPAHVIEWENQFRPYRGKIT